jgi:restriction system protein
MNNHSPTVWVIRAGQMSSAHHLFIKKSLIVLADQGMGNLRLIPKRRSAFYSVYSSCHSAGSQTEISGIGGKFFRFIHEMNVGDLVLYPCRLDQKIYFGKVTGAYFYDISKAEEYPHRRKVRWEGSFPKGLLSESCKKELGAARTFFRFLRHVEELKELITAPAVQEA